MYYQNKDPKRMAAKFDSKCCKCNKQIKKGQEFYYFPAADRDKRAYCLECGETDFNFAMSAAMFEDQGVSY